MKIVNQLVKSVMKKLWDSVTDSERIMAGMPPPHILHGTNRCDRSAPAPLRWRLKNERRIRTCHTTTTRLIFLYDENEKKCDFQKSKISKISKMLLNRHEIQVQSSKLVWWTDAKWHCFLSPQFRMPFCVARVLTLCSSQFTSRRTQSNLASTLLILL